MTCGPVASCAAPPHLLADEIYHDRVGRFALRPAASSGATWPPPHRWSGRRSDNTRRPRRIRSARSRIRRRPRRCQRRATASGEANRHRDDDPASPRAHAAHARPPPSSHPSPGRHRRRCTCGRARVSGGALAPRYARSRRDSSLRSCSSTRSNARIAAGQSASTSSLRTTAPPLATAPMASSRWNGTPSLRTHSTSSGSAEQIRNLGRDGHAAAWQAEHQASTLRRCAKVSPPTGVPRRLPIFEPRHHDHRSLRACGHPAGSLRSISRSATTDSPASMRRTASANSAETAQTLQLCWALQSRGQDRVA